jgi:hypothetical protein
MEKKKPSAQLPGLAAGLVISVFVHFQVEIFSQRLFSGILSIHPHGLFESSYDLSLYMMETDDLGVEFHVYSFRASLLSARC